VKEKKEYRITLKKASDIAAYLEAKRRMRAETNAEVIRTLLKTWKKARAMEDPKTLSRFNLDRCRGCSSLTLGCTYEGYCPRSD
jgi:hypothetical protein